jgi:hypothetical protein
MRIKDKDILDYITESDLPQGFQYVAELCSLDIAKDLMLRLGGIHVYIPQVTSERIITPYIKKRFMELTDCGINPIKISQMLVTETGLATTTIRKIINSIKNKPCKN